MKILNIFLTPFIASLVILPATTTVCQADVNQIAPTVNNSTSSVLNKSVSFPANFSLVEFLDIISRVAETRLVAPGDDNDGLTKKLNASLGNKTVALKEAFEKYFAISGLAGYGEGNLSVVEAPFLGSTESNANAVRLAQSKLAGSTLALNFIASLSKEQVSQIYRDGFGTVDILTPEQKPLYVAFVRHFGLPDPDLGAKASDEEILKQPIRFSFARTASFSIEEPGKSGSSWIGLYDYGTGLIWNPLASFGDAKPLKKAAMDYSPGNFILIDDEVAQKDFIFDKTESFSLIDIISMLQKRNSKKIVTDKRLTPAKMQEAKVIVSKGTYTISEMREAVSATIGAEFRDLQDFVYLGQGDSLGQNRRSGQIFPLVQKVEEALTRLPVASTRIPFFSSVFNQRRVIPFAKLQDSQKFFLRKRIENERNPQYSAYDLETCNILFANTIWITEIYIKSKDDPINVIDIQVW